MEPALDLYVDPSNSACCRVSEWCQTRSVHGLRCHDVDREPRSLDEVERSTGKRLVPCLRDGEQFVFGADSIIQKLEMIAEASSHVV
eukprot:m51a1_g2025 hypothetical protein (87) ;mRNA; r:1297611-1297871